MSRPKTLQFGALLYGSGGHIAGWRYPGARPDGQLDFSFYAEVAQTLERGGFSTIFIADVVSIWGHQLDSLHRTARADFFEPLTLLSALSTVTERIGLVATATTSYNEPYTIARKFASLDHISGGRAGWNVVTSVVPLEAANFGKESHFTHAERYERAAEFVEIVTGLWDSYTDDAVIRDKQSGIYFRHEGRQKLDHRGTHFRVDGPLNVSRPPQGHPVIFQAGASDAGRAFAARYGEVLFTAPPTVDAAILYRQQLDDALNEIGRDPDDVRVWPLLSPIVADTDEEATRILDTLGSLIHDDVLRRLVQDNLGDDDLSDADLDAPLTDNLTNTNRSQSRRDGILAVANAENLTLRQLGVRMASSNSVAGSPATVADHIATWFASGAIDGFNVSFPYLPDQADRFVNEVLPLLESRGIFVPATGSTLRESLGLPRPAGRVLQP